jgi:hypothetical protein
MICDLVEEEKIEPYQYGWALKQPISNLRIYHQFQLNIPDHRIKPFPALKF